MALGRPWNNQSVTIYIQTYMGSVVNASGFTAWAGKVFDNVTYAEYGSYGPGYVPSKRLLDQETLGSAREGREKYTVQNVFGE
jgi:pectin methylesterase-like acyl-CoA thioesterase